MILSVKGLKQTNKKIPLKMFRYKDWTKKNKAFIFKPNVLQGARRTIPQDYYKK